MNLLKALFNRHKLLITYGMISVFVLVIDVIISYSMEYVTTEVIANTTGVVAGFIIQYFLVSKKVFNSSNLRTFIIFLITFLFSLMLADGIVFCCRTIFFKDAEPTFAFFISKGFSIVIPFFLIYYIRLKLIPAGDKA